MTISPLHMAIGLFLLTVGCQTATIGEPMQRQSEMRKGKIVFVDEGQAAVCLANVDGTQSRILATNGKNPLWFPSGDKVVYMTHRGDPSEIVIIDLAGKVLKRFQCTGTLAGVTRVTDVSADGTELMLGEYNGTSNKSGIYTLNVGTGMVNRILTSDDLSSLVPGYREVNVGDGSWSASDDRIAFTLSCRELGGAIGIMNRDGFGLRLITEFPSNPKEWSGFSNCGWSPSGKEILAVNFRFPPGDRRCTPPYGEHIFVVDVGRKSIRKIPSDYKYQRGNPCWSPDGSMIIYSETRIATDANVVICLMVMNADGANPHRVFSGSPFSFMPFMGAENHKSPRWWEPKE